MIRYILFILTITAHLLPAMESSPTTETAPFFAFPRKNLQDDDKEKLPLESSYHYFCPSCKVEVTSFYPSKVKHKRVCIYTKQAGWKVTNPTVYYDGKAWCPIIEEPSCDTIFEKKGVTFGEIIQLTTTLQNHIKSKHPSNKQAELDATDLYRYVVYQQSSTNNHHKITKQNKGEKRSAEALEKISEEFS